MEKRKLDGNIPPKKLNEFIKFDYPIPTEEDIKRVIEKIEAKLAMKEINQNRNFPLKEGYTRAIENLKNRTDDYEGLKTVQGRAIASLAYEYLQGRCSEDVFCGIPVKTF